MFNACAKQRLCNNIYNVALTGLTYYILNFIGLTAYAIKYHPYGVYHKSYNGILLKHYPRPKGAEV